MNKITKYSTTKAEKVDKRILRFIGSDQLTDRDGDKIMMDGWNLTEYRKNPVVMFGHNYKEAPVARTKKVWIDKEKKQLLFDIEFPDPEISSVGDSLYKLYKSGFMQAVSVGFTPDMSKIEYPERKKDKDPYRVFGGQALFEISLCSIPANPRALLTSKSMSDAITKDIIDDAELQELINCFSKEVIVEETTINETEELKKTITSLEEKVAGLEFTDTEESIYAELYKEYVSCADSELSIDSLMEDMNDTQEKNTI